MSKGKLIKIGVIGAGAMGTGIAQVAATFGHEVVLYDLYPAAISRARATLEKNFKAQVEKGRMDEISARAALGRIDFAETMISFAACEFVIEAALEDLRIKQEIFKQLEDIVAVGAVLASNTSSLSIASIASGCKKRSSRVLGVHFFNPPTVLPLVEIIPAVTTAAEYVHAARELVQSWGKVSVVAKDTPGFIVNRIARPFYGEALRILEEGIADPPTIDWAMKELGGFKMGPFELMDFIGNDVNFRVTETVFELLFYDSRYRPSHVQKRMVEAGYLGRKSGHGFYDYRNGATNPEAQKDKKLGEKLLHRILAMLINEASDALLFQLATRDDIDLAMTKGVNYPQGLLKWADQIGTKKVLGILQELFEEYGEDRYRPSAYLRRLAKSSGKFYE